MSDLSIYLGSSSSCADAAAVDAAGSKNEVVVWARTLREAIDKNGNPWNSLHISVAAHEFSTAWSNPMDLASFQLNDAAVVTVAVRDDGTASADGINNDLQAVHTAFLLAGLQGTSERKEANGTRVITAQKKARTSQPASAQAIALKRRVEIKTQQAAAAYATTTTTAVTISLDDDDDDDDVMIDEDDLLQDEGDLAPDMNGATAATATTTDDCGGRTACDDCTCGRAEQEQAAGGATTTTTAIKKAPIQTSACGKCGLGDAFRCASCPYLGKPAFKAGEEHLVLDLHDDF